MKIKRICEHCNKEFIAKQADVVRGWAKFCSKSCKAYKQEEKKKMWNKLSSKTIKLRSVDWY